MTGMSSYVTTALAMCCLGIVGLPDGVQTLILQGSTTFNTTLMEPSLSLVGPDEPSDNARRLIEAMQRRAAGAR